MKVIIFAGGVGRRLWPLSRQDNPKQFQKLYNNKTSLENSYETIRVAFDVEDIFISTGADYVDYVKQTLPNLPQANVIVEPCPRDTGPAVAWAMAKISEQYPHEPVLIRWQNSIIRDAKTFKKALYKSSQLFDNGEADLVYLGVPAKYANTRVGYIRTKQEIDEEDELQTLDFSGFTEKPDISVAKKYVEQGTYAWNPGCYITTPQFMLQKLSEYSSEFYKRFCGVLAVNSSQQLIKYGELSKISIDFLLWEKLNDEKIKVVVADYDWHYVSSWTDLKKALQENEVDNVVHGEVITEEVANSLLYNYNGAGKMLAVYGINNVNVIDTPDATLVVSERNAGDIKQLLKKMKDKGLNKYL